MPELMEAWIKALARSRRAMLGADHDDRQDPILISLGDRLERLRELRARLVGGRTTGFVLVLIPERLPIEETARALAMLDDAAVRVGALVVNRVLPEGCEGTFLLARRRQERVYLDEIARRFRSHPVVHVPQLESDVYGLSSLEKISGLLFRSEQP
jgi:arsenite-transporting ATPase